MRGGLATYVRKPLQIEASKGNEYGLHTKIILPNSQRINVVNVYIPPATSLTKRNILETHATAELEKILDTI
jgi:exonuclease III